MDPMKSFREFIEEQDNTEEDYRGDHTAPGHGSGSPLHDLRGTYPDDFYSHEGFRYYANEGTSYDMNSYDVIRACKNRPNKMVRVYRAVPPHVKGRGDKVIQHGDWVTPSRGYALDHVKHALNGKGRVLSKVVKARHLYTSGDSIHELGYDTTLDYFSKDQIEKLKKENP